MLSLVQPTGYVARDLTYAKFTIQTRICFQGSSQLMITTSNTNEKGQSSLQDCNPLLRKVVGLLISYASLCKEKIPVAVVV